jgi:Na+/melibiose symporter-like transporter
MTTATAPAADGTARLPWRGLAAYGAFGMPLNFLALPLYITLPEYYARRHGLELALIGGLLMASRLIDAFVDPLIGRWIDRARGSMNHAGFILLSLPLMLAGFAALFLVPPLAGAMAAVWLLVALLIAFTGFSLASIAHNAWGAELSASAAGRARVVGIREGFGLAGLMTGALVPQWGGMPMTTALLGVLLVGCGAWLLLVAPRPPVLLPADTRSSAPPLMNAGRRDWLLPLSRPGFGALYVVFVVNGIASAVPATLLPFFVNDALGLARYTGVFLGLYFIAGALSVPLWVRGTRRFGLARAWLAGMALAIGGFCWAYVLPDLPEAARLSGFIAVVLTSGLALGADLVAPAALLAGIMHRSGDSGHASGGYFGLWNFGAKLTLALAAGLALPLLQVAGYSIGTRADPAALTALAATYCLLPCALKALAAGILWRTRTHLAGD